MSNRNRSAFPMLEMCLRRSNIRVRGRRTYDIVLCIRGDGRRDRFAVVYSGITNKIDAQRLARRTSGMITGAGGLATRTLTKSYFAALKLCRAWLGKVESTSTWWN